MNDALFPLKISIGLAGKNLVFNSVADLRMWAESERTSFEWISKAPNRLVQQKVWTHIGRQFKALMNQLNTIEQHIAALTPFQGNIEQIVAWFTDNYENRKLVLSTSSEFKFVEKLRTEDPAKAVSVLGHLLGVENLYKDGIELPSVLDAAIEAHSFQNGQSRHTRLAEKEALNALKNEWDLHLADYRSKQDELSKQFESTQTNIETYFADAKSNSDTFATESQSKRDDLVKTYDQFMALKAPVDYWEKKREHHEKLVPKFRNWSLAVGILGGILLLVIVYWLFQTPTPEYWKIGILVVIATLIIWLLRLLVRQFLSHIHLEADARERVVMTKTYLALLREHSGLDGEDKKLILTTLFRPSTAGLIKDDAIPPGLYDLLTRAPR